MTAQRKKAPEMDLDLLSQHYKVRDSVSEITDELEKARKKYYRKYKVHSTFAILLCIASIIAIIHFQIQETRLFALLFIFLAVFSAIPIMDYRRDYKNKFMPKLLKELGNLSYNPKGKIKEKRLIGSGLFRRRRRYEADNHAHTKFGEIYLEFARARFVDRARKDPKSKKHLNIFDGLFILLHLPEKFEGHTFATTRRGTMKDKAYRIKSDLIPIPISDEKLSHTFDIYTTHPLEAQKLVTKALLHHMSTLDKTFDGAMVEAVFYDNYLLMSIDKPMTLFDIPKVELPAYENDDIPQLQTLLQKVTELAKIIESSHQKDGDKPTPDLDIKK